MSVNVVPVTFSLSLSLFLSDSQFQSRYPCVTESFSGRKSNLSFNERKEYQTFREEEEKERRRERE